jgi:hypothetical protein
VIWPGLPVPVSPITCGLPGALSTMETTAARVPVLVGANVTLIVQLAPGATEAPHVLVSPKSAPFTPVTERVEMSSGPVPLFDNVTA